MFGYGFLAVVLVLYLAALGIPDPQIGLLLSLTLVGDTVISLWLTTHADRVGRRRVLLVGAALMVGAGTVFASPATRSCSSGRDDRRHLPVRQRGRARSWPSSRRP